MDMDIIDRLKLMEAEKVTPFQRDETLRLAIKEIRRLRTALQRISTQQKRIAAATDMTRPAMREAAAETCAEITAALGQHT